MNMLKCSFFRNLFCGRNGAGGTLVFCNHHYSIDAKCCDIFFVANLRFVIKKNFLMLKI